MAVGETGNFAAYGFAPITLIAPLGCVSVTGKPLCVLTNRNLKSRKIEKNTQLKQQMHQKRKSIAWFLSTLTWNNYSANFSDLLSCCHINHEETCSLSL